MMRLLAVLACFTIGGATDTSFSFMQLRAARLSKASDVPIASNTFMVSDSAKLGLLSSRHLLLHSTPRKFLFCMIPKNACSEFLSLTMRLDGMADSHWNPVAHGQDQALVHYDEDRKHMFFDGTPEGRAEFEGVMGGDGWTKAVFLRDPVSRLLAAYGSKVQTGYYESNGYPRTMALQEFVRKLGQDGLKVDTEPHLRPQSYLCDLNETIEMYDFVGDFGALDEDTHRMVTALGGTKYANEILDDGWGKNKTQSLFGVPREVRDGKGAMTVTNSDDYAQVSFQSQARTHSTVGVFYENHISEADFVQSMLIKLEEDPALLAQIKDLYAMDYDLIQRSKKR